MNKKVIKRDSSTTPESQNPSRKRTKKLIRKNKQTLFQNFNFAYHITTLPHYHITTLPHTPNIKAR